MVKYLNDHHSLMGSRHGQSLFGRLQKWDRATGLRQPMSRSSVGISLFGG